MSRLVFALLLVLAASPRALAAEPRPIAVIPAQSAIQAGKTLVLWAPDLRSVLGYDAAGKRLWRLATGDQGGLRDLAVIGGNVVVYTGTEAILVAPDSGKVRGRRANVELGSPGGPRGCRVNEHDGACALECECSFEIVACDSLASLGEPARLPHFEERDADGTPGSRCAMFSGGLIGRSGDAIITSFPAATDKPFFSVPEITIARHAHTGAELWRSTELGFFDEQMSGVADAGTNGGTCYAASRAGSLTVFDCQRATVLWKRTIASVEGGEPQIEATPQGIFVRDGTRVALLDTRSGRPSWQFEVPATSIVLLAGMSTHASSDRVVGKAVGKAIKGARILNVTDGKMLGDVVFPPGTERWPRTIADLGWVVVGGKRIEAFDAAGMSLGGLGSSASYRDFMVGSGANIAAWDSNAISLANVTTLTRPVSINGSGLRVVAYEGVLGAGRLAVFADGQGLWDPKKPESFGELRLFRLGR